MNGIENNVFTEEIPVYGDKMTVEEWKDCVAWGGFIDYDGFGSASDGKLCTKKDYHPSQADELPEGTTHIIWYNR